LNLKTLKRASCCGAALAFEGHAQRVKQVGQINQINRSNAESLGWRPAQRLLCEQPGQVVRRAFVQCFAVGGT
jgi:hypothetical protein